MARAEMKPSNRKKAERAPTSNLTLRLKPLLLDDLKAAAAKHQSSITGEIERRLMRPDHTPVHEIGRAIGLALESVELRTGSTWRESDEVRAQMRAACDALLSVMLGDPAGI